jgi:L-tartrate/succinate antiporter
LAILPPPPGLAQHSWYYFALFAAVIAGLMTEPLPNAAVGLIGLSLVAVLSPFTLFDPQIQTRPGFNIAKQTINWALAGFSNPTVWLIGAAFMFALGYQKSGLGRRIALLLVRGLGRNTLSLGYACTFADAVLAPFTPSNIARGSGIVFPIVSNLPPLYKSLPNDPSARLIGGYLMWTSFAACCVTSTLFMTALAPNFLAVEFARKIAHVDISFLVWMRATLPFALPLLLALPLLTYVLYRPGINRSAEAAVWAGRELTAMGPPSRNEIVLGTLVMGAIVMWVAGGSIIDPTLAALLTLSLMLITGVLNWDDVAKNHPAWSTLVMLACLITLADGLGQAGFIKWFAAYVAARVGMLPPELMITALVAVYFLSQYMFAGLAAHTAAMLPVLLGVGLAIPGISPMRLALGLAVSNGLMGVITPYATGVALPYYNSGYIPRAVFWRLGATFGAIFLASLLGIGLPLLPD